MSGQQPDALAAGAEMEEKTLVINDKIKRTFGELGDSAVQQLHRRQQPGRSNRKPVT